MEDFVSFDLIEQEIEERIEEAEIDMRVKTVINFDHDTNLHN